MNAESTALLAIERRVRSQIAAQLAQVTDQVGAKLGTAIKEQPDASATEILSRADVHDTLTSALDGAQADAEQTTRSAYEAAAVLALIMVAAQLGAVGHDVKKSPLPDLGNFLDLVIAAIDVAFSAAFLDIHNAVRAAHDGVTGRDAVPARILTTNAALRRAVTRLRTRVTAAAVVATHRGFTDAQQAAYAEYTKINPYVIIKKTWTVQAKDPCAMCAALHGTTVGIDEEFSHAATTDEHKPALPVYENFLPGPPRHPNCRCRLTYQFSTTR